MELVTQGKHSDSLLSCPAEVRKSVGKSALDILDERYARGDIRREDYGQMKTAIARL